MLRGMTPRAGIPLSPASSPLMDTPRSAYLEHLIFLPSFPAPMPARDRLDSALGPDLARFLIAALTAAQSRGSSSP
jgi:hypothetical protein